MLRYKIKIWVSNIVFIIMHDLPKSLYGILYSYFIANNENPNAHY